MFSALYSILPSSKKYLIRGDHTPKAAASILLAGFVGGFIAISIVSRFVHHHQKSQEVACAHSHHDGEDDHMRSRGTSNASRSRNRRPSSRSVNSNGRPTESTPLVAKPHTRRGSPHAAVFGGDGSGHSRLRKSEARQKKLQQELDRRPSMQQVRDRVMSFVKDTKTNCGTQGPCYGFTGVCGQQCFKQMKPTFSRVNSQLQFVENADDEETPSDCNHKSRSLSPSQIPSHANSTLATRASSTGHLDVSSSDEYEYDEDEYVDEHEHHHHVPDNPYTDISYQTSIAIALHKIPEGFMTYATNHANPDLGFSVFMALFVHNITEGFALALPIYLATQSRMKALLVTLAIGGISQPLGAGVAALWFKIAGSGGMAPGNTAYGIMFAVTAGVMTSVALSFFKEGMDIGHNRESAIYFAFLGMSVMALSKALTA